MKRDRGKGRQGGRKEKAVKERKKEEGKTDHQAGLVTSPRREGPALLPDVTGTALFSE